MQDILFLLNDDQYEEEIVDTLRQTEYIYHRASNLDELITVVRQDSIDLVIVWLMDVEMVRKTISVLNQNAMGYLPVVAVIHHTDEIEPFFSLQIADIIMVPIPREEFLYFLNDLVKGIQNSGDVNTTRLWEGNLEEFSLVDLIQMVESNHKDAILTVNFKGHLGHIYFRGGKVIKVSLRNLSGLPALFKLASLHKAEFQIQFTRVQFPDTLQNTNQELLVAILSHLSDQEKLLKELPDTSQMLVSARFPEKGLTELQHKILQMCRDGLSIEELLITLNEDNIEILQEVRNLIQEGFLVSGEQQIPISSEGNNGKGLGGLFKKITRVFKGEKEEEREEVQERETVNQNQSQPQENKATEEGKIFHQPAPIPGQTIEKIQKFLKEL